MGESDAGLKLKNHTIYLMQSDDMEQSLELERPACKEIIFAWIYRVKKKS